MSLCPPGSVFNPQTLRCVKSGGRLGRRIQTIPAITRRMNTYQPAYQPVTRLTPIPVYDTVPQLARAVTRSMRQSRLPVLAPDSQRSFFMSQGPPALQTRGQPVSIPAILGQENRCPAGKILNPETGKCVKVGGRVQRRLQRLPQDAQGGPPMLYTRKASKIPVGPREAMKNWISTQCANTEEPFTGKNLKAMADEEMVSLIKTSAGTCLRAEYLDRHIRHERERRTEVMDPMNPRRQLTLSNMDILGRTIRQVVPNYRVPQYTRKAARETLPLPQAQPAAGQQATRQPPVTRSQGQGQTRSGLPIPQATSYPDNWKFFIGKDARSGNDFYSVYYYDKDQATVTNAGVQIPTQAIVIDLGIIPAFVGVVESGNPACTTSTLVEKLLALHRKQKLLHKLGNQLVATIELPGERARWKTPDGAIQRKFFQQVCAYLDELVR
jgi:hypothetical protein